MNDNSIRNNLFMGLEAYDERVNSSLGPHILLTRFGIGVVDACWIDFRLKLFKAITLPSVVGQSKNNACWCIFIDFSWPKEKKKELFSIIKEYKFIKIFEIDFYFQYYSLAGRIIESSIEKYGSCLVSKIDDDDALSLNSFEYLYSQEDEFFIYTFSNGFEFLPQERMIRRVEMPFLTMNTHFNMRSISDLQYIKLGHHRVNDIAKKEGRVVAMSSNESVSWLYSRHKQSDSRFAAVRKSILVDAQSRVMNSRDYLRFGVNFDELQEFRKFAVGAGGAPNEKTWLRQSDLNSEAQALYERLNSIKEEIKNKGGNIITRVSA